MGKFSSGIYALMVSIVLWGTVLGGITYSHLVYFPAYLAALPDSSVVVNGPYGLQEGIFWGLIHPLLILSLIISTALNWRSRRRKFILTSFAVYAVVLIVSWTYFIPELSAFRLSPGSSLTSAEWLVRSDRWQHLSWVRGAVMYTSFVPLLFALATRDE